MTFNVVKLDKIPSQDILEEKWCIIEQRGILVFGVRSMKRNQQECADKQAAQNEEVQERMRFWKPNEDSLLRKE